MLVDESASVGEAAEGVAKEFAEGADFGGADVAWMAFAGDGRVAGDAAALDEVDREALDPSRTRVDVALALTAASFRPGRVRTAVVFSDGVDTGGAEVGELATGLAERGIRVHVVPVTPPDEPEVLVREVRVPSAVRVDEPVAVEAVIQSNRETTAGVDLFRNGIRIGKRSVTLAVGSNALSFDDRAGDEKLLNYEVGVRAVEDTLSQNNLLGAAAVSDGAARVLLLTDRLESARHFEWALKQEGIELSVRPGEGAPNAMSDLRNFDTLVIDNVPASDFSRDQMELFHAFVRDFGGGLLMLGGDEAFGLGGYFRTPVEDVLPVRCDFQKEEETPSLALCLVIDRSGSMSGVPIELAKSAAKASVDLLGPKDYASVVAFDNEAYPVVPLQSAANAAGIGANIASIQAGGGTSIAPAMEEALRQLSSSAAKLKHVILLTDGVSSPGPFYELTSEMARGSITVSTVAVGSADTALLSQIAGWGNGRFYETSDWSTVPQIFTKETMTASKSAIQEFPFLAKPVRAVDFLEGVPWDAAPFLLGYVRTKAKPTSETWLVTERGDPLLTTWRYGLGTTAAFTSDARNRWAVEWLRWPGYGKFWGQLLRRLGRAPTLGLSEVSIQDRGERAEITVDALDPAVGFPDGVTGSVRVAAPGGEVRTIPLRKVMPGRWVASFETEERGITSGQVVLERGEELFESRFFTHSRGFSAEYRMEGVNERWLGDLAAGTGGVVGPDGGSVFLEDERTAAAERELWPWLALAGLLIFVGDVGIRRWPE